jgi:signal transduction histidine kinase
METPPARCSLDDPRLAAHATDAAPVWVWSADGARVLWANPAGCAAFGAESLGLLAARRFEPGEPVRRQVARLAATLPPRGTARLERLRGLAPNDPHGSARPLACACALFNLDDAACVLVMAAEAAGPALSLAERIRRLDLPDDDAIAAFAPDGAILFATADAKRRLAGAATIDAIGAQALCAAAAAAGAAAGETTIGPARFQRIGSAAGTVLLARFERAGAAHGAVPDTDTPFAVNPAPAAGGSKAMAIPDDVPATADKAIAAEPRSGDAPQPPSEPAAPGEPEAPRRRRHPLRFAWQMDPAGCFTLDSDEFTEIIGARTVTALGRPWQELGSDLGLDPTGRIARATATRETWSNITVSWPIDGGPERLDVELAGLPAFDRDRNFLGYRGFGVCRDMERVESLRAMRLAMSAPAIAQEPVPPPKRTAPIRNVVPFPGAAAFADAKPGAEHKSPTLSAVEQSAFRELSRQLTARLQDGEAKRVADVRDQPPPLPPGASPAAADGRAGAASEFAGRTSMPDEADPAMTADEYALLNRLPLGILVYRFDELLFANRAFLAMTGYTDLGALTGAGGLDALFAEWGALSGAGDGGQQLAIATRRGNELPVEGRLFAIDWNREPAFAVVLTKAETNERIGAAETAPRQAAKEVREPHMTRAAAADTSAATPSPNTAASESAALAKLCHHARTPLTSILGFCDMMLEERFGPIGNDRYRDYVGDVRKSGAQLMSLLTDTADLAEIEAGTFRLPPSEVSLNEVVDDCVARMQSKANEARLIVRMSLSPAVPHVIADAAAVRRMAGDLIGHAFKASRPGGQVIVSTGVSEGGDVILRVRDSSGGPSEKVMDAAPKPAGPEATWSSAGQTLRLTKALAEANQARFRITSTPDEGSLFELSFTGRPDGTE